MTFVYTSTREEADRFIFSKADMERCFHVERSMESQLRIWHKLHKIIFVNMPDSFVKRTITSCIMDGRLNFTKGQYAVIVRGEEFKMVEQVNWIKIEDRPQDYLDYEMLGCTEDNAKQAVAYWDEYMRNRSYRY